MINREQTAAITAFMADKWPEVKGYALLVLSVVFEMVGFAHSLSDIQDFITWGVSTLTAVVGVYFVWIQIQAKKLDMKIKQKQLEDETDQ